MELLIISLVVIATSIIRLVTVKKLNKKIYEYATDISHVAYGYLTAASSTTFPIVSVVLFVLFMSYQLVDYLVEREDIRRDLIEFGAGIVAYLGRSGISL